MENAKEELLKVLKDKLIEESIVSDKDRISENRLFLYCANLCVTNEFEKELLHFIDEQYLAEIFNKYISNIEAKGKETENLIISLKEIGGMMANLFEKMILERFSDEVTGWWDEGVSLRDAYFKERATHAGNEHE